MKIKILIGLLISLITIGCDNQYKSDESQIVQDRILVDEDFIDLMTMSFLTNKSGSQSTSDEYTENIFVLMNRLELRYRNFDEDSRIALENKNRDSYKYFESKPQKKIDGFRSSARYDAESTCGNPCPNAQSGNVTLGCIVGCNYSEIYCLTHGGTNCSAMQAGCKGYCCDNFCPAPY